MHYLLLGAGLQGAAIAHDLIHNVDDTVALTLFDRDPAALDGLAGRLDDPRVRTVAGDVSDPDVLAPLMDEAAVVISAVNYWFNESLTRLAVRHRAHFLDLGGNNDVVQRQFALDDQARKAGVTVIPDCGLAPGLAGLIGHHLHAGFDACDAVHLRVGGLPRDPRPPLNYMLVFSAQGLINEYIEPAEVIRDGEPLTVPPLSELEDLVFPAPYGLLEAFQTSGGTSTLPLTLAGKVRDLDYKTIRYPGHCEQIRLLLDMGLTSSEPVTVNGTEVAPRDVLAAVLERHLPTKGEDVVLMLCSAEGTVGGRRLRRSLRVVDGYDAEHGISAMARMTGYPTAIIAEMLARGAIDAKGARPQELVVPADAVLSELAKRGVKAETWEEALG